MPRKRTATGRARIKTPQSNIYLQAEKINKMFRRLERGKNYGTYTSKRLAMFAKDEANLEIKKGRSGRHRLRVKNLARATQGRLALITKRFKEFISSKASTNVGITKIRRETKVKVTQTLRGMIGRDLSRSDIDLFWEIIHYKSNEIIQRIGPSEFYVLVMTARDASYSVDEWVEMIDNYVTVNNDYIRKTCEYLYYKFVK